MVFCEHGHPAVVVNVIAADSFFLVKKKSNRTENFELSTHHAFSQTQRRCQTLQVYYFEKPGDSGLRSVCKHANRSELRDSCRLKAL